MNAPIPLSQITAAAQAAHSAPRLREIPYNYTSFSDREIVDPFVQPAGHRVPPLHFDLGVCRRRKSKGADADGERESV